MSVHKPSKLVNLFLLLGFTGMVFSFPSISQGHDPFPSSFFIGLGGGAQRISGNISKLKMHADPGATFANFDIINSQKFSAFSGAIHSRLGFMVNIPETFFTFGMNVFYTYAPTTSSLNKDTEDSAGNVYTVKVHLKSTDQYGINFLVGTILLKKIHVYLLGGISSEMFKIRSETITLPAPGGADPLLRDTANKDFRKIGFTYGLGMEKEYDQKIRYGMEFQITFYANKINMFQNGVGQSQLHNSGAQLEHTRSFRKAQALFFVTYNFTSGAKA